MAVASAEIPNGKLVIRNIGLLLSGDLQTPILAADTVVTVDGIITAVGKQQDCDIDAADRLVDAKGTTVSPGLIDSHVHPVFGDWTPAPKPDRLDRQLSAWRDNDDDLRRGSPSSGTPHRHCRP